jgi:hypothetical protein
MMEDVEESRLVSGDRSVARDDTKAAATATMGLPGTGQPKRTAENSVQKDSRYLRQTQSIRVVKKWLNVNPCIKKSRC